MTALNVFDARGSVTEKELVTFIKLLYPVAPHICSEIYEKTTGGKIEKADWPTYSEEELIENEVEIPVQLNGKLRKKITVSKDAGQDEVVEAATADGDILCGKRIIKIIYVKGRILNIVAK
jgi:leucyl-tRNA synthetase